MQLSPSGQPQFPYATTLTFARHEGFDRDTTTLAILTLTHEADIDQNEVFHRLTTAITDWVRKTDSGKQAWQNSSQDFNIGDLIHHDGDPALARFLHWHGLHLSRLTVVDSECAEPFDTVLVDTDKLS